MKIALDHFLDQTSKIWIIFAGHAQVHDHYRLIHATYWFSGHNVTHVIFTKFFIPLGKKAIQKMNTFS